MIFVLLFSGVFSEGPTGLQEDSLILNTGAQFILLETASAAFSELFERHKKMHIFIYKRFWQTHTYFHFIWLIADLFIVWL